MMPSTRRPKPLVLCILDGFGERLDSTANAVRQAKLPILDGLRAKYPFTTIGASGEDVGLPHGQMGNSEVGHLNFGAGRVAMMDLSKIDNAVARRSLDRNPVISHLMHVYEDIASGRDAYHQEPLPRFHLFALLSDGGVHSSIDHLFALIDVLAHEEIEIVVHVFLDGRDTPPKSAMGYVDALERKLHGDNGEPRGIIGTVSGRFYAMDRDKRWDRVHEAYRAIVHGYQGTSARTARQVINESYAAGITDEFIKPTRIGEYQGLQMDHRALFGSTDPKWKLTGQEVGLCVNFRPDRMRELCAMLLRKNLTPEVEEMLKDGKGYELVAFAEGDLASMTEYDPKLEMRVAYPKESVKHSFGEVIANLGLKQFRCAETEKYAHVTYFFNGGHEAPFPGEERKMLQSPRDVATYDLKPEMSAAGVTDAVLEAIASDAYDFVLLNYANPDMVGHTGDLAAATRAVEAVDEGLGRIVAAVREKGGAMIITSDHGNCETMVDENGQPHTAHTTNPVPLYYINDADPVALVEGGKLADVAPTMLEILGVDQPGEMTGTSLRRPSTT